MQAHLQLSLEPMWPTVREIRQRVGSALQDCPDHVRSAAIMTSSELVENAIKYGESVPGAKAATFVLDATAESVSIRVVNGSTNRLGVAELERRVRELRQSADKQALYLARVEELLADDEENGNLGIYRIGFEGGFELELDYTNQVVTVTATRNANA
jgi:hypothetical protein